MDCPLCNIDQNRKNEKIYFEDDEIVLLDAKTKKGHEKRIMFVLKSHIPSVDANDEMRLLEKFAIIVSPHFASKKEFYIYGTMNTIKNHWHKIACVKNENAEDYKELFTVPRDDLIKVEVSGQLTSSQ